MASKSDKQTDSGKMEKKIYKKIQFRGRNDAESITRERVQTYSKTLTHWGHDE